MDVDWDRYQDSTLYKLQVSIHFLGKQSPALKQRFFTAVKDSSARNGVFLLSVLLVLWLASAGLPTYGLALVAAGAVVLAWTPFRLYVNELTEPAAVPDNREGPTPHQRKVSLVSRNVADAGVGFLLVATGFAVRIATSVA
ncbi:hypothetical protein [Halobacterium hubeiense]|uniref:hypothetical protein n=1 Tax=Halobacterium hubeiense TaxID=1407499 RepID=UPI003C795873